MRIIHLTDPHLTDPALPQAYSARLKRRLGMGSWQRRRGHIHRRDTLTQITDAVAACQGDVIALTGDLTQIGLAAEIEEAGVWLRALGGPDKVILSPGNHDLYAGDSQAAVRRFWQAYLPVDYPDLRLFSDQACKLRVLNLCSALPTPVGSARGALGVDQLARLKAVAPEPDTFTLAMLHHPPLVGQTSWRKALREFQTLPGALTDLGAQAVLHGHCHRNVEVSHGDMMVWGTASASAAQGNADRRASFRVLDLERQTDTWLVHMQIKQLSTQGQIETSSEQTYRLATAV